LDIRNIDIDKIILVEQKDKDSLSAEMEDGGLKDFEEGGKELKLLSLITVIPGEGDQFLLIAGQRRLLACKKLGRKKIPALIKHAIDCVDTDIISKIENVHRACMDPFGKSIAFQRIYEEYRNLKRINKE